MNGKDLLALVLMIFPSFLAMAVVIFTFVQYPDVATGPAAAGVVVDTSDRSATTGRTATQKRMRDPWEKPVYAKSSSAPRASPCDPATSNQDTLCFYW